MPRKNVSVLAAGQQLVLAFFETAGEAGLTDFELVAAYVEYNTGRAESDLAALPIKPFSLPPRRTELVALGFLIPADHRRGGARVHVVKEKP